MSEDGYIEVDIGGEPGRGRTPAAESSETELTRAAFARRAHALNELREVKLDGAAAHLSQINAQTDAATSAAARALESGDWDSHAKHQRTISELAVERGRAEDVHRYWQNQPVPPADPVEAFIASRANEPGTQKWLREHPSDALALATGHDPRRVAKLNAAHNDAIAEGHASGSEGYFKHVDRYLGGKAKSAGETNRVVHVVKTGQQAHGDDQLTKGEYKAATETVCWGNENPAKRGEPIGVVEYLKRRNQMRRTPGWFNGRLD